MVPCLALAAPVLGSLLPGALGHAYLAEPPARNLLASARGAEYCPHCLQSGGPDAVRARGRGVWPTRNAPRSHGLCGDPVQGQPSPVSIGDETYLVPTPVQRTYRAGEIAEFVVGVSTHHMGHYEFRVCDRALDRQTLAGAEEGQACLDERVLHRAPPDASCVPNDPRADCQPIDERHPERWYLPPPNGDAQGASWSHGHVNQMPALTESHVMRYLIPKDLNCTHCTLQWYWATGNTCFYDGDYFQHFKTMQGLGWNAGDWAPWTVEPWATCGNACCGVEWTGRFGEEFWNCADIAVLPAAADDRTQTVAPLAARTAAPEPAGDGTPASLRGATGA